MADKKIIAVIGATGAQGGGAVRAILNDKSGEFAIRAITRNANSEKARELSKLGVDVVSADLDSEASLTKAFTGVYGAFCVTNYWEHFQPEKEIAQIGNLARAAKAAGVKHVIWSTLEDTRKFVPLESDLMPTLQGKYKVPHFDTKGGSDHFFTDAGVPTTFLLTSYYWDNAINFGMAPQPGPDGQLAITYPLRDKPIPGIAAEDIGKCALGIFKAGPKYIGKTVGIAGEHLTGAQMAAAFSRALGVPVKYNDVPANVYRSFGFPGADDLGNMFQFKREFNADFCGVRNVAETRNLNPELQTFDQWLAKNKHLIKIEQSAGA